MTAFGSGARVLLTGGPTELGASTWPRRGAPAQAGTGETVGPTRCGTLAKGSPGAVSRVTPDPRGAVVAPSTSRPPDPPWLASRRRTDASRPGWRGVVRAGYAYASG